MRQLDALPPPWLARLIQRWLVIVERNGKLKLPV